MHTINIITLLIPRYIQLRW